MAQLPNQPAVVQVKRQPNIYTVLLIVAILALAITIGFVLYNLMAEMGSDGGYDMTLGEIFNPSDKGVAPGK